MNWKFWKCRRCAEGDKTIEELNRAVVRTEGLLKMMHDVFKHSVRQSDARLREARRWKAEAEVAQAAADISLEEAEAWKQRAILIGIGARTREGQLQKQIDELTASIDHQRRIETTRKKMKAGKAGKAGK
jgi:uncharacterized coiled-coil protein SlyX